MGKKNKSKTKYLNNGAKDTVEPEGAQSEPVNITKVEVSNEELKQDDTKGSPEVTARIMKNDRKIEEEEVIQGKITDREENEDPMVTPDEPKSLPQTPRKLEKVSARIRESQSLPSSAQFRQEALPLISWNSKKDIFEIGQEAK